MRTAKILDSINTLKKIGVPVASIVDVGIQHSTPVLMSVYPELHHYLFEPVEEYYSFIRDNYSNFSYSLIEAAVSDFDGNLTLQTEKKTRGDEISHSYLSEIQTKSTRSVRSLTLDKYFSGSQIQSPFLLKIDVEGADVPSRILAGAEKVLEKASVVVIEMTVDKFLDRSSLLEKAGFDLWDLCDLCYYGNCLWQTDAVFVKREIKQKNIAIRPIHDTLFRPDMWQSGF